MVMPAKAAGTGHRRMLEGGVVRPRAPTSPAHAPPAASIESCIASTLTPAATAARGLLPTILRSRPGADARRKCANTIDRNTPRMRRITPQARTDWGPIPRGGAGTSRASGSSAPPSRRPLSTSCTAKRHFSHTMMIPTRAPAPAPASTARSARSGGSMEGVLPIAEAIESPARNSAYTPRFRTPLWSGTRNARPRNRRFTRTRIASLHESDQAEGFQARGSGARNWVPAARMRKTATFPSSGPQPARTRPGITTGPRAGSNAGSRGAPRHLVDDRFARERLRDRQPHQPPRREHREAVRHAQGLLRIFGQPEKAAPALALEHERLTHVFLRLQTQPLDRRPRHEQDGISQDLARDDDSLPEASAQAREAVARQRIGDLEVGERADRVPADRLELQPPPPGEGPSPRLAQDQVLLDGEMGERLIARVRRIHEAHPRVRALAPVGRRHLLSEKLDRSASRRPLPQQDLVEQVQSVRPSADAREPLSRPHIERDSRERGLTAPPLEHDVLDAEERVPGRVGSRRRSPRRASGPALDQRGFRDLAGIDGDSGLAAPEDRDLVHVGIAVPRPRAREHDRNPVHERDRLQHVEQMTRLMGTELARGLVEEQCLGRIVQGCGEVEEPPLQRTERFHRHRQESLQAHAFRERARVVLGAAAVDQETETAGRTGEQEA